MKKENFNPNPYEKASLQSDVLGMPRYSKLATTGYEVGPLMDDGSFYTEAGLGQNTSGSGLIDWGKALSDFFGAGSSIVTSIWGTSDKYMANAYQTMYNNERKTTNTMIAIVIAFVLLAFAFLLLKKK